MFEISNDKKNRKFENSTKYFFENSTKYIEMENQKKKFEFSNEKKVGKGKKIENSNLEQKMLK